jgi:hypothetical protein
LIEYFEPWTILNTLIKVWPNTVLTRTKARLTNSSIIVIITGAIRKALKKFFKIKKNF